MKTLFLGLLILTMPSLSFACRIEATSGTQLPNDNLNPTDSFFEFSGAATLTAIDCQPSEAGNTLAYEWYTFRPSDGNRVTLSTTGSATIDFGGPNFPYPDARFVWLTVSETGDCPGGCGISNLYYVLKAGRPPQLPTFQASQCFVEPVNDLIGYRKYVSLSFSGQDPDPVSEPNNIPADLEFPCESLNGETCATGTSKISMTGAELQKKFVAAVNNRINSTEANGFGLNFRRAVELQVSCQNEAPLFVKFDNNLIQLIADSRIDFSVSDLEADAGVTYSLSLVEAPQGAVYSLTDSTGSLTKLQPLLFKGNFGINTNKIGSYTFSITLTDSAGNTRTEQKTINFVSTTFKVLLDNEEYLFEDCSPDTDPCKLKADEFRGGEFLIGDIITLASANSTNLNIPVSWKIQKINEFGIPEGILTELEGTRVEYLIPNSAGKYRVTMITGLNNDIYITKDIFAGTSIQATFLFGGPFFQSERNFPGNPYAEEPFGKTRKDPIKAYGCTLISVANILNRSLGDKTVFYSPLSSAIGSVFVDPLWTDRALVDNSAYDDNDRMSPSMLDQIHRLAYPMGNGLEYRNLLTKNRAMVPANDIEEIAKRARKRKYTILRTKSNSRNNPESKDHYVSIIGIRASGADIPSKIIISDPFDRVRNTLNISVYQKMINGFHHFDNRLVGTVPQNSFYIASTDSSNFRFEVEDAVTGAFSSQDVYLEEFGNDDDLDSTESKSGYWTEDLNATPGIKRFTVTAGADGDGSFLFRSFNRNGGLNNETSVPLSMRAGEVKELEFFVDGNVSKRGAIKLTKSWEDKSPSGSPIVYLEGTLNSVHPIPNYQHQSISLKVGNKSYFLEPGELRPKGNGLEYVSVGELSRLFIDTANRFQIVVSGTNLHNLFLGFLSMSLQTPEIGYSILKNAEVKDSDSLLTITTERRVPKNTRSIGMIHLEPKRMNSNAYFYEIELLVNGQRFTTIQMADGLWRFETPRLLKPKNLVEVTAFVLPKKQARAIKTAIARVKREILVLNQKLDEELDPDRKDEILVEIAKKAKVRDDLKEQCRKLRIKIGRVKYENVETF